MSTPISTDPPMRRSRRLLWMVIAGSLILAGLFWMRQANRDSRNWDAVMTATNEGLGLMERFEYAQAAKAFEKAVELAPEWLPAQVNLGIATFNLVDDPYLAKAIAIFQKVLSVDPDHRHAHFCLGVIYRYQGKREEAYREFAAVQRLDAEDAQTWYNLGDTHPDGRESRAAFDCFEKALELDPYLNAARYALANHPLMEDPQRKEQLLNEFKALIEATWEREFGEKYTEVGKYAEVIGRVPTRAPATGPIPLFRNFAGEKVELEPNLRWLRDEDLPAMGPIGGLRHTIRERLGAALVVFDYDADDLPDVFMVGAVRRDAIPGNRLFRNEGKGHFRDVTVEAKLDAPANDLGCCVADFDNDGFPDLFLSGDKPRFFRNLGNKTFADLTIPLGFHQIEGLFLAAVPIDIDQDGDLDVVMTQTAKSLMHALGGDSSGYRVRVLLNTSEAPIIQPGQEGPPLKLRFQPMPEVDAFKLSAKPWGITVTDLDDDRDLDLLIMLDEKDPVAILNDRLLRFRQVAGPLSGSFNASAGVPLDANHNGEMDLFVTASKQNPRVLVRRDAKANASLVDRFRDGFTNSSTLIQAQAVDVDQDGRTDILGIETSQRGILLQQDSEGRFVAIEQGFGPLPVDLIAGLCADLDGDCQPDFLGWSNAEGLVLRQNVGNGNRAVRVRLLGQRTEQKDHRRTNLDGIGSRVIVQAGPILSAMENTTLSAGLGQSRLPLTFGVGKSQQADIVRVRWPDQVPQAELNVGTCDLVRIVETNRKPTSCPILFTWNGSRYEFITDLLGGGALGESGADGSIRPARPSESIVIESHQLIPQNGQLLLKLAEPMDEVMYLDRVQLDVIDHPANVRILADERFTFGNDPPTEALIALSSQISPRSVRDHRGHDISDRLRDRDGRTFDRFLKRPWLGYAEEHSVELDFADLLKDLPATEKVWLVLTGGTDYPYPESIYAATQAGIPLLGPVLERKASDGTWTHLADIGFPAGLTKTMTFPLSAAMVQGNSCVLRIRTNMQIYWDQIVIGRAGARQPQERTLPISQAQLRSRGFAQEITPSESPLIAYDDSRSEIVAVSPWKGQLTRYGDVTTLLREEDDCFALCGPGDEVEIRFDAGGLPPLPDGWKRSFILRSKGYCKDHSPFTVTGGEVGPLPFRGMKTYPPGPDELSPSHQRDYAARWNTRSAAKR